LQHRSTAMTEDGQRKVEMKVLAEVA